MNTKEDSDHTATPLGFISSEIDSHQSRDSSKTFYSRERYLLSSRIRGGSFIAEIFHLRMILNMNKGPVINI